ncbi:hypothetical protein TcWFU_009260 [Taenia crassiceps]|uniref:Uncharacterized protein n=1 Tax=Taenia crassiceps TaxID=6207 RepID=A0ABR4Q0E1_9CEST
MDGDNERHLAGADKACCAVVLIYGSLPDVSDTTIYISCQPIDESKSRELGKIHFLPVLFTKTKSLGTSQQLRSIILINRTTKLLCLPLPFHL